MFAFYYIDAKQNAHIIWKSYSWSANSRDAAALNWMVKGWREIVSDLLMFNFQLKNTTEQKEHSIKKVTELIK